VASKEIVVVCGPGGVGKTTLTAALGAMAAVSHGGKVLVVTVDPSRRLGQALGLQPLHRGQQKVPDEGFKAARVAPKGELWAELLDTKAGWDALVKRHAPDPGTARRILANQIYQDISERFIQSHDYMAVERLFELHSEGDYDLVVVDTPPTRNAVDFLLAPERMADFFSSRLLRLLATPYRSRLADAAARPFYYVADRVLGTKFLEQVAEFFILFQTLSDGFVARAKEVERLLADARTAFVVVSTLETVPVREAEEFLRLLPAKGLHAGGLVLNRALPAYLFDAGLATRAAELVGRSGELARALSAAGAPLEGFEAPLIERVLVELAVNFDNVAVVAKREAARRAELSRAVGVVAEVPELADDVHDLGGVLEVGRRVWSQ